ncbi:alpha/beta fold hydrolase [Actinomycetospora rhizophila]|uniref:Alpha/beta fold hydrolase n=1 Tax=Actinomycetospora rhizophila TaxID=1416876 RepID=A0ABV9ZC10_9PSEU
MISRPLRVLGVVLAVGLLGLSTVAAAPAPGGPGSAAVRSEDLRIDVRDGPARDQPQSLDATLWLPATSAPAPAVLVAHGFGGSKQTVADEARTWAERGYVALAWSARGFGASTGQIALNSPEYEVTDAQQLVDWLAARPEVRQDGPGDPRVGVTGASYGGALSLLLAGYDRRVDATIPMITWNDLGQSLFPNRAGPDPAATPAASAAAPDGVFKKTWAALFFSSGSRPGPGQEADAPQVCGRFLPEVCAGYTAAATTGREPAELAAFFSRASPASIAGRITAPTLLVQGERDTLFGLDQADANARGIAAGGGTVAVSWFAGGHDGGGPDTRTTARMQAWFDHHLAGTAPAVGTEFTYVVPSGVTARSAPTQRTITASVYPGLDGAPGTARTPLALRGEPQDVVAPAGGAPAAISSIPGLGALTGAAGGSGSAGSDDDEGGGGGGSGGGGSGGGSGGGGGGGASALLGRLASDLPAQSATFSSDPLTERTVVAGTPRVRLGVAAVPGRPAGEPVLFAKVYDVAADGATRTLLGSAVSPLRLPAPGPTPTEVDVSLPAVVATLAAGHRLEVAVATTDQAFAAASAPAVHRISLAGDGTLSVPTVPGDVRSGTSVPLAPLVAAGVLLLGVLLAWLVARVLAVRRRRRDLEPGGALALAEELADTPLVVRGLSKSWPSGLVAVDDVSFTVERGQVLGLLGPNGAGKTTTLRMLLGLIAPTAGELRLFGRRVVAGAPVLGRVGAFVEGAGFLPHLTGRDNLELYWAATGRPREDAHLEDALEIAGLGGAVDRTVRTYSQGMRQRLAIAQAMLGLPDLLVLDEPTNGLDPPQIHAMREVLRSYARDGHRTVLVSSHLLAEVEQTCDHVVVMHRGRVVATGEVAELVAGGQVAVTVSGRRDEAVSVLRGRNGVRGVEADASDADVVLVDLGDVDRAQVVRSLVEAGFDVRGVGPRRRLEDAFLALIGEEGSS